MISVTNRFTLKYPEVLMVQTLHTHLCMYTHTHTHTHKHTQESANYLLPHSGVPPSAGQARETDEERGREYVKNRGRVRDREGERVGERKERCDHTQGPTSYMNRYRAKLAGHHGVCLHQCVCVCVCVRERESAFPSPHLPGKATVSLLTYRRERQEEGEGKEGGEKRKEGKREL